MSSAAVAVAMTAWRQPNRWVMFVSITIVFFYTSITNIFERPEGIKIASVFILSIVVMSLVSRALRSTELRVLGVEPDDLATQFIDEVGRRRGGPDHRQPARHRRRRRNTRTSCARRATRIICRPTIRCCFSRCSRATPRSSARCCTVHGVHGERLPRAALPEPGDSQRDRRAAAAHPRSDRASCRTCTSAGPKAIRSRICCSFLAFGEGDTAPVTREVLRQAEADPLRRPRVHVG